MMTTEMIKNKMTASYFLTLDKNLIRNIGYEGAAIYTEFVNRSNHYANHGQLAADGFFFCTVDDLERECSVSKQKQQKIIKQLEALGLIDVRYSGLPKRRYIRVRNDEAAIQRVFADNLKHKEIQPFPEQLKEKSRGAFDSKVLEKQIDKAVAVYGGDQAVKEGVKNMYAWYLEYFGNPDHFYTQEDVLDVARSARGLNLQYNIFDQTIFHGVLDAYNAVNVDTNGGKRSINHMLRPEMLYILFM